MTWRWRWRWLVTRRAAECDLDDELRVEEGSLYPALHRMESEGWVDSEWKLSATNRRVKLYRITAAGRKQLAHEQESWERLSRAVGRVLRLA